MTEHPIDTTLAAVVHRARALAVPGQRHILGLAGAPGAGKSTVAEQLVDALGPDLAVLVPMDGFHLANEVLLALGRLDRKGAPDTFDDAGYADLLRRIRAQQGAPADEVIYAPRFRRGLDEPIASSIPIRAETPLVVTEGNYLLLDSAAWVSARSVMDEVWFLAPAEHLRLERLIRRHEAYGKSRSEAEAWALGTDQRNAELIAATAGRADLVLRIV